MDQEYFKREMREREDFHSVRERTVQCKEHPLARHPAYLNICIECRGRNQGCDQCPICCKCQPER